MKSLSKDELAKQQIRDAARGLFQKWGLVKTTMEDIAKATRKGKSTLYYYFKSKEDIFEEIANEELNSIVLLAKAAMEQQATAEGKMRAYLLCTIAEVRQRISIYSAVFGDILSVESIISKVQEKQNEREFAVISKIIADGVRSGELRLLNDHDVNRLAKIFMLTFKTIMAEYVMANAFDEASELTDLAVKVFINGLRS